MPLPPERLDAILSSFPRSRILVIGDLMLDEFLWGKVTRISPEAPVPVVDVQRSVTYPGGAANVARNLASLGARWAWPASFGEDHNGKTLVAALKKAGIDRRSVRARVRRPAHDPQAAHLRHHPAGPRPPRDRGPAADRAGRQRAPRPLPADKRAALMEHVEAQIAKHDAVILEDYAKGLIDQELVTRVIAHAQKPPGKIVAIDPNPNNPIDWSGATVLKPNRREAFLAAQLPYSQDEEAVQQAAACPAEKACDSFHLLITLGEAGMLLLRGECEAVPHAHARAGCLRRFRRGRHGHRGLHALRWPRARRASRRRKSPTTPRASSSASWARPR